MRLSLSGETKSSAFSKDDFYCDADDYTFYKGIPSSAPGRKSAPSDPVEDQLRIWAGSADHNSYDCQSAIGTASSGPRLLACRSFQNRYWSCTVRGEINNKKVRPEWQDPSEVFKRSKFMPGPVHKDFDAKFLFPTAHIVEMLSDVFRLQSQQSLAGLLLVAGATKSAKTKIARGLIYKRLLAVAMQRYQLYRKVRRKEGAKALRLPHLVTFEDPVEEWFWGKAKPVHQDVLDYTPRQYRRDADCLQAALTDALRQTPSIFYIGEVRNEDDWKHVIEFAGTGHLVVATAHGGSLTESMVKIFKSIPAETAAARKYVADRVLGAIHVRLETIIGHAGGGERGWPQGALVGSIWRRTHAGIHALTSDGFTSLLPTNPNGPVQPKDDASCFGQCWWAKCQFGKLENATSLRPERKIRVSNCRDTLLPRLLGRDLEGEVGA